MARQRLAGVEDPGPGAGQRRHPARRGGRDTGEVGGEVEGRALGGEQGPGRAGHPHHHVAGGHAGAVGDPVGDLDPRRRRGGRRARPRPARPRHPARGPRRPRAPVASAGMVATLVTSTAPPGRSSSRAASMAASTASGSSPASRSSPSRAVVRRRAHAGTSSARRRSARGPERPRGLAGREPPVVVPGLVGVVAVGEVLAPVGAAGLLTEQRRLGQEGADGEQVGGLPGVLVDRRRQAADQLAELVEPRRAGPRRSAGRRLARSSPPAAGGGLRRRRGLPGAGRQPGRTTSRSSAGSTSAMRRENTRPSSRELEASRLAPCTPEQATSPVA